METKVYVILVLIVLCGASPQVFGSALQGGSQPDAGDSSQLAGADSCTEPGGVCPPVDSNDGNNQDEPKGIFAYVSFLHDINAQLQTFLHLAKDQSIQLLRDELNRLQRDTKAEIQQLRSEMASKDQRTQAEIQQLKTEMAARNERIQQQQDDIEQLTGEGVAKNQKIQALEQRNYIERCESGVLDTPYNVLASGSGSRYRDLTATFSTPFRTTPVVTVGIRKLDIYRSRNTRISTTVTSKSPRSLTVRIITWADTRVHVAGIYWMACA
ncbi:uncharacterized protein LOC118427693 isoform X2 [Branchiostoma floridae]|uniref:Uncharacterized protein LOC118427693 isoform X2 n=1 Tax=Branchiostoma floridae TaxID=7739 RepID=A0A9J7N895_BRAFL|nr:uncharacterized protein LOC118427693 isoform X2 [Branchiostoma floridae]